MKSIKNVSLYSSLLLLSLLLTSCVTDTPPQQKDAQLTGAQQALDAAEMKPVPPAAPATLPVRYQSASYLVDKEELDDITLAEESKLKVGARITSTRGPQPLWDILKRLAALKGMNISWASDVDRNVLVDVNIGANDDFYRAIDNLLRQVDYYHEMEDSTIVIKYKETRQFHIAMPFTKQTYETATGGNVLGSNEAASNIEGTIRLDSRGNEFDIWKNIELNMKAILDVWTTKAGTTSGTTAAVTNSGIVVGSDRAGSPEDRAAINLSATRQVSATGNKYTIDKPVGIITVHAPRPLLNKLEVYFDNLKKELYRQVSIEAKILEVHLDSHSSIGLNWNQLLENLSVAGGVGTYGKTYDRNITDSSNGAESRNNSYDSTNTTTRTRNRTSGDTTSDTGTNVFNGIVNSAAGNAASFGATTSTIITNGLTKGVAGAISLAAFTFDSFLNAVSEQGETTILANPKISVLNGQPALITVGRNVTYIEEITQDSGTSDSPGDTFSVTTARVLSGVGLSLTANILDDNQIILNLVPVTSEIQEPIEYRQIGAGEIGLPIINIREMSTTVKVQNEEMLVIGGLISSIDEKEGSFIPGTSKIPFFKYLFGFEEKTKRKRELIILLKPKIM
jgi:MSHA type pilus biogenesis protein MshL